MRMLGRASILLISLALAAGCTLSPDQKVARETALKQAMDSFVAAMVKGDWNTLYMMSDGGFNSANSLKDNLTQTWVTDATLNGGEVTSMAWIDDGTSKVKVNWNFQAGSVQSYTSDTYVFVWAGGTWKYKGRMVR